MSSEQSNKLMDLTVKRGGRAVLAKDGVLGGAEGRLWSAGHRGR
jgi:hypothetical protein